MSEAIISLDRLHGACHEQLDLVRREWPDGIPLTEATVARCLDLSLDLEWAAKHLLSREVLEEYECVTMQASEEYERVKAQACEEYNRVRVPTWEEYNRVKAQAWEEYERVRVQAFAEYHLVKEQALEEYERVKARSLLQLLLAEKE